jgi:hypothetical protein
MRFVASWRYQILESAMKITTLFATFALVAAPAIVPSVAHAAHAGAPYKNVNKQNDAGNDTGDSQVDKLNAQQLNQNYQGQNPGDQTKR